MEEGVRVQYKGSVEYSCPRCHCSCLCEEIVRLIGTRTVITPTYSPPVSPLAGGSLHPPLQS